MPAWWHELSFDVLCLLNSIAATVALVGVHSVRKQLHEYLSKGGPGATA